MSEVAVLPQEVLDLAAYYKVDLEGAQEYWLLPVAKQAVIAPVLPPWREEENENGEPVFVNTRTGEKSGRHPLDAGFLQLVHAYRAEGAPADNALRTWMQCVSETGQVFYHDFASGEDSNQHPGKGALLPEVPAQRLPKYSARPSTDNLHARQQSRVSIMTPQDAPASPGLGVVDYQHIPGRLDGETSTHLLVLEAPRRQQQQAARSRLAGGRLRLTIEDEAPTRCASSGRALTQKDRPLEYLTFHSQWFEDCESSDLTFRDNGEYIGGGLRPRHATLKMSLKTNAFDVVIHGGSEGEPNVELFGLTSVTTTAGMPVQPWDVHVGATLELLGNYIMLRSCSAATGDWLNKLGTKVMKIKDGLLTEFRKYNQDMIVPALLNTHGAGGGRLSNSYCAANVLQRQGGVRIQSVADQILRLCDLLEPFRPTLAESYRQKLKSLQGRRQRELPSSGSVQSPQSMLRSKSVVMRELGTARSQTGESSAGAPALASPKYESKGGRFDLKSMQSMRSMASVPQVEA